MKGTVKVAKAFRDLGELLHGTTAPAPQPTQQESLQTEATAPAATATSRSRSGSSSAPAPQKQERGYPERTEKPKDTAAHHVVVTVPTRAIPPQQKIDLATYLKSDEAKAALDRHSQAIADPKTFEALEVKQPNFAQEMKSSGNLNITSMWDTKNWPEEIIMNMARNTPEAAMSYAISWRTIAIKQQKKIAQLETRLGGLESQLNTEIVQDQPKQPDPAQQPQPEVVEEKVTPPPAVSNRSRSRSQSRAA